MNSNAYVAASISLFEIELRAALDAKTMAGKQRGNKKLERKAVVGAKAYSIYLAHACVCLALHNLNIHVIELL
jgi:hypothetical protein